MSPLTHAVCLVDHEQAHRAHEEPFEEVAILETLRREVQDLAAPFLHALRKVARLAVGQMRMHGERVHTDRCELVLLILHERDERTHDDREARAHQRWKLIYESVSGARGGDDERVLSIENGSDRFPLTFLELLMTEAAEKEVTRLGLQRFSGHRDFQGARTGPSPKSRGRETLCRVRPF